MEEQKGCLYCEVQRPREVFEDCLYYAYENRPKMLQNWKHVAAFLGGCAAFGLLVFAAIYELVNF
jgi:hypothetical protein